MHHLGSWLTQLTRDGLSLRDKSGRDSSKGLLE